MALSKEKKQEWLISILAFSFTVLAPHVILSALE